MTPLEAFALGVGVGSVITLALVTARAESVWHPAETRREHAVCVDCDGITLVRTDGRCDRCGSASVWFRGARVRA